MSLEKQKAIMQQAINQARSTMNKQIGGPFGAVIVDENDEVIAISSNSVLRDHDPTAHAEINAIRLASKAKKNHDLTGCTLYTTAYPCPMCLGAIIWANIKKVYYGCLPKDADAIGFRDDFIYDFIANSCQDINILSLEEKFRQECLELFSEYQKQNHEIY